MKTKTKMRFKRIISLFVAFVMIFMYSGFELQSKAESFSDATRFGTDYSIDRFLSQYSYFVSGDLEGPQHIVGSMIIGGTYSNSNSFGNVMAAPSYIKNIAQSGNLCSAYPEAINQSRVLFYDTYDASVEGILLDAGYKDIEVIRNNQYINVNAAISAVTAESKSIASAGNNTAYTVDSETNSIILDFSKAANITIPDTINPTGYKIVLKNITMDQLFEEKHVISFECADTIELSGSMLFLDGNSQPLGNSLKQYACDHRGAIQGGQYLPTGFGLVWNIPYSDDVTFTILEGHLVVPQGHVYLPGGNLEGNIIAKSAKVESQSHFYPKLYDYGSSNIIISKVISDTTKNLEGAELQITSTDSAMDLSTVTVEDASTVKNFSAQSDKITWTSTSKNAKLCGLKVGRYMLTETKAPEAYEIAEPIYFKVVRNSAGNTEVVLEGKAGSPDVTVTTIKMEDKPYTGEVKFDLTKVFVGKENFRGNETFKFEVFEKLGDTSRKLPITGKVTNEGKIAFDALILIPDDIGTHYYYVKEVKGTTSGIEYDEKSIVYKVEVTVNDALKKLDVQLSSVPTGHFKFTNKYNPKADCTFSKVNAANSEELPGAKLMISTDDSNIDLSGVRRVDATAGKNFDAQTSKITWESTSKSVEISGLPIGIYTLTEITAPDGFEVAETIVFKVVLDAEGNICVQVKDPVTGQFTVTDKIVMKDEPKNAPTTTEETTTEETTTEGTTTEGTTTEETTTEGTTTEETTTEATTTEETTTEETTTEATTTEGPTTEGDDFEVQISKVDAASKKELSGAKLAIITDNTSIDLSGVTRKDSSAGKLFKAEKNKISWTSTDDAVVLVNLPVGEYTYEEITAPSGYEIADPIEFRVVYNSGKIKLQIKDSETGKYVDADLVVMEDEKISGTTTEETTTERPTTTEETTTERPTTTEETTTERPTTTEETTTERPTTTEESTTGGSTGETTEESTTGGGTSDTTEEPTTGGSTGETTEEPTTGGGTDQPTTEDPSTGGGTNDPTTTSEPTTQPDNPDNVKTGDNTNVGLLVVVMIICATGFILLVTNKKKWSNR